MAPLVPTSCRQDMAYQPSATEAHAQVTSAPAFGETITIGVVVLF